jgi:hypothetical protein
MSPATPPPRRQATGTCTVAHDKDVHPPKIEIVDAMRPISPSVRDCFDRFHQPGEADVAMEAADGSFETVRVDG